MAPRRWIQWLRLAVAAVFVVGVLAASQGGERERAPSSHAGPGPAQPAPRLPITAAADESPSTATAGAPTAAPTSSPPAVGAASTSSASPGSTTVGRPAVGPDVHGVTDEVFQVGVLTYDSEAVTALLGASTGGDADMGNASADATNAAAVDAVNALGGIAGRRVETVAHFYKSANYFNKAGREREAQAACATWTEDNSVFAIAAVGMTEDVIVDCAADTRTVLVAGGYFLAYLDDARFATMPEYWYAPAEFLADRRERAVVSFLAAHDFFDKDSRVGVLIEDRPSIRAGYERGGRPALAAAGVEPVAEIVYPDVIESPWANYVLQLRTAGVTHVVWSAETTIGFAPLFMLRAAEEQGYRPRWGLGSDNGPAWVQGFGAPVEQLANVIGVGWKPVPDIADESHHSESARRCGEALAARGQDEAHQTGRETCDALFFLRAAFELASEISPAGLAAGAGKLGSDYASVLTIDGATSLAPARHDGAALARLVTYDRATDSFVYSSPPEPLAR